MAVCEIKRPGHAEWETATDLKGFVPLEQVVGSLIRYPESNLTLRVAGLTPADATGTRQLLLEVHDPEGGAA